MTNARIIKQGNGTISLKTSDGTTSTHQFVYFSITLDEDITQTAATMHSQTLPRLKDMIERCELRKMPEPPEPELVFPEKEPCISEAERKRFLASQNRKERMYKNQFNKRHQNKKVSRPPRNRIKKKGSKYGSKQ